MYCTMLGGCKLKGNKASKWPKLVELHTRLYPEQPTIVQSHRAMADVQICRNCYFKMTKAWTWVYFVLFSNLRMVSHTISQLLLYSAGVLGLQCIKARRLRSFKSLRTFDSWFQIVVITRTGIDYELIQIFNLIYRNYRLFFVGISFRFGSKNSNTRLHHLDWNNFSIVSNSGW